MVEIVAAIMVLFSGVGAGELVRAHCARAAARSAPPRGDAQAEHAG